MAIANIDIYEKLEYKFLYKKDINSIHILLNLYDLDKNIRNIYPKYISIQNLRNNLLVLFKDRINGKKIANCISSLLHEDINRLELYICLEGYKNGHFNKCLANKLENITIKNMDTDEIYNSKYLYHYKKDKIELRSVQDELLVEVKNELESEELYNLVREYFTSILEPKINMINKKLLESYRDIDKHIELSESEIDDLKVFTLEMLLENIYKLYKDSYWYGLNDRVLKRYK